MEKHKVTNTLQAEGTRLHLEGKPFYFQGLSFFNAIFNKSFNESRETRLKWLQEFKDNGMNALRFWGQYNFDPSYQHIDSMPKNTLYTDAGDINDQHFHTLCQIILDADRLDMVIELAMFVNEKKPNLTKEAQERATAGLTERLKPYRNIIMQIWNEKNVNVMECFEIIKKIDGERLVANSICPVRLDAYRPLYIEDLGTDEQHRAMDILTPHTVRGEVGRFWETAPLQLQFLLDKYQKPVIDDEPARCGTEAYGGIAGGTQSWQHIEQIKRVRQIGAYHTYHHDMFQYGYGHPSIPSNGIPYPDFSAFHREVFDYLKAHKTW